MSRLKSEALSHDVWIKANSEIEPQRLHALGVITFRWNTSEQLMLNLFAELLNTSKQEAEILVRGTPNDVLVQKIKDLAHIRYADDRKLIHLLENAIAVYDVCRQNRNQFTHFNIQLALRAERTSAFDFVRKKSKKHPLSQFIRFPDTLTDIRRVAREIRRLNVQLKTIGNAVILRHNPKAFDDQPERKARVKAAKELPMPRCIWAEAQVSK